MTGTVTAAAQDADPAPAISAAVKEAAETAAAAAQEQSNIYLPGAAAAAETAKRSALGAQSSALGAALGRMEDGAGSVDDANPPIARHAVQLAVFVSSSMPTPTLRAYAAQLEGGKGVLVFRGVPGGLQTFQPFIDLSSDILKRDLSCEGVDCPHVDTAILIDPVLFRAAGISQVPAVGVVEADLFSSYCERESDTPPVFRALSYGDAHLSGHLEALARLGETRATALLSSMREGRP